MAGLYSIHAIISVSPSIQSLQCDFPHDSDDEENWSVCMVRREGFLMSARASRSKLCCFPLDDYMRVMRECQ